VGGGGASPQTWMPWFFARASRKLSVHKQFANCPWRDQHAADDPLLQANPPGFGDAMNRLGIFSRPPRPPGPPGPLRPAAGSGRVSTRREDPEGLANHWSAAPSKFHQQAWLGSLCAYPPDLHRQIDGSARHDTLFCHDSGLSAVGGIEAMLEFEWTDTESLSTFRLEFEQTILVQLRVERMYFRFYCCAGSG
jgi:hypothetical protein